MTKKKNKSIAFPWQPFSDKQLKVLTWWTDNSPVNEYDGIICDGAVRSGKSVVMSIAFVNWAMVRNQLSTNEKISARIEKYEHTI